MAQHRQHGNHIFSGDFGHVLFCRVDGLRRQSTRKGLVPALITLVLMALITERGLSSTHRKPIVAVPRTVSMGTPAPAFMDSL